MNSASLPPLEIVVVSDVVCPWCYVGKRQLDAALAQWRQQPSHRAPPVLRWLPFQLNPDMPAQGMPRSDYLERKFGSADPSIHDRVRTAARTAGLDLQLAQITRQPNTLKAHALIDLAAEAGLQSEVAEALFSAYFLHGRDLSDDAQLRAIAEKAGMNDELVSGALTEEAVLQRVAATDREIRERGVQGVPLFVIGLEGQAGIPVNGAQGTAALLEAMNRAGAD